jgi:hypothetical protein
MTKRVLSIATLLIACLSATLAFGAQGAAAQEDPSYQLDIMTYQCEESPCEDEPAPIGDVTVLVASEDGSVDYGSCTTTVEGNPGGCTVNVDPETTVSVTVDETTIPDGYVLLDFPVVYDVPAEKEGVGDVQLYFTPQVDTVPDDQDTDEEVVAGDEDTGDATAEADEGVGAAELPSTGSGTSADSSDAGVMALGIFGALSLFVVGGMLALRRWGSTSHRS